MLTGRKTIANRLSRYVLLITAGLFLFITLLIGVFSRALIERVTVNVATAELDVAIRDLEKSVSEVESAVDNVDWFVQRNSRSQDFMYEATRELVLSNPSIIGSAVAFEPYYFKGQRWFAPYTYIEEKTGEVHTIQMGGPDYDYPELDWYRVPRLHDKAVWSEPYFDAGGGSRRMATYSMPLRDTTGAFFGILTSDISLEDLSDRLQVITPYGDSYMAMVSARGVFIAHPDSTKILNQTIFDATAKMSDTAALVIAREMLRGRKGSARVRGDNGQDYFAVYGPLRNGWSVLLVNSYASVFKYIYAFNAILAFLVLIGLAGMYFGCRKVVRRQTMPIVEFSQAAMTMAKGNFKARIPEVRRNDELLTLRNSLAYMQKSLNEYLAELKLTTASNERYESELNIARGIQMGMLPQDFPQMDDCSLHAMVHPAKEVGGDLYDFIKVGDSLYFLVGDVSGKGVPAALFMAITRAAFRFVGALGLPMDEVLRRVNNCLCDGNKNQMFVTIFAGRIDLKTGEMEYCNAGHNPIVVISPGGKASFLRAKPNLAAGLFEDFPYEGERMRLERGSRLLLYTDGVTEAERADKSQFGEDRLLQWAGSLLPGVSADASTIDLYAKVRSFTQGADQNDDITIMSILLKQNQTR